VIVSVSLGSDIHMVIGEEIRLERRSALILRGKWRYEIKHGIVARKSDDGVKRGRRVSLTFRTT
jgi:alkylated DNA repair dioxygenase AlkB